MHRQKRVNDAVHWYMSELRSRIVASSGRPSDRFHLGKIVLQSLKDAPDFVLQIDGATGEKETNGSVLKRSIQCANALQALGLQRGDVTLIMAPNHLDSAIPFYAALYLGIIYAPIDMTLTVNELQAMLKIYKPKVIYCQSEKVSDVQQALEQADLEALIIVFNEENKCLTFSKLLEKYGDIIAVDQFKPAEFDPENTIAFVTSTSGTTALPKAASSSHKNVACCMHYIWSIFTDFPTPSQMSLLLSPLQWLSATANIYLSPVLRYTRVQTSLPLTQDHIYELINIYKPTFMLLSPNLLTTLIKPSDRDRCDFSSFEFIGIGGSAVPPELIRQLQIVMPQTYLLPLYGMSEVNGPALMSSFSPLNSSGSPVGSIQIRLVDINTQEDIIEPNVSGELWLKGPSVFMGYYNDPVNTKEAFAEDGWLKTGDLFYRDETWNFYFVDRIKSLLKYKNHHVYPVEVENVIRKNPGVFDVVVTGIPDAENGDLVVACVVRNPGYSVTAHDIKQLIKDSLTDSKQLRGGVIFFDELPMTASTKVDRRKLKNMVLQMDRE